MEKSVNNTATKKKSSRSSFVATKTGIGDAFLFIEKRKSVQVHAIDPIVSWL